MDNGIIVLVINIYLPYEMLNKAMISPIMETKHKGDVVIRKVNRIINCLNQQLERYLDSLCVILISIAPLNAVISFFSYVFKCDI